jgi:hypothetical protein
MGPLADIRGAPPIIVETSRSHRRYGTLKSKAFAKTARAFFPHRIQLSEGPEATPMASSLLLRSLSMIT